MSDSVDGLLADKRYLIHDRDPLFTADFLGMLKEAGVEAEKLLPRSPDLNAHAERVVRSIKEFCLERLILFGGSSLRTAVQNFVVHYHRERNHQGLGSSRVAMRDELSASTSSSLNQPLAIALLQIVTSAMTRCFKDRSVPIEFPGHRVRKSNQQTRHVRRQSGYLTAGFHPTCIVWSIRQRLCRSG